jgi:outer membrane lipoprotein-sorting protein
MDHFNGTPSDTLLEQATNRLRETVVVEMRPDLIQATIEAIANKGTPRSQKQRRPRIAASMAALATMFVLMATGVALFVTQGAAQVVFAQVLDNAKNADSVVFWLSQGIAQGAGKEYKCFAQGEEVRVEHPSGIVIITDTRAKKRLYLDAKNETAGLFAVHEHAVGELATGMVEQLRHVRPADAKPIGKEVIDGKTTEVFRVPGIKLFGIDSDKGEMRIWVDPTSMLPWRLELRIGAMPFVTLRKLEWNLPIEASLLSMDIPNGYTLQPEDVFRKALQPDADTPRRRLTPNEAFRQWIEQSR